MRALAQDILARAAGRRRYVFAIAGAPGAGKSTLAEALLAAIEAEAPGAAALIPMDGFHLDNAVLDARGLRARKGSPETFDVDGLAAMLARVRAADRPVAAPVFDRDLDLARAGARIIAPEAPVILLEGNYLLLRDPPWDGIAAQFERTLYLDVAEAELERRLVARWLRYGLDAQSARARAEGNDLPNARLVAARSKRADIRWTG
ncbi:MAG: nucleoside/nucleotide kinase family protein [Rhodobacteraceae bacterium]|nr:nucleoside/nucleotide kinase family protein [Paracoccaceae bacterium]